MLFTLVGHFPRKISLNNKAERFFIASADGRSRLQFETMADHSSSYAVKNSFLVVNGLLALPLFLFSVYLTVRLRKRAWNTTSKRFTRFLEIFFLLHYFLVVIFCLKFGGRLHYYCFTIGFLAFISVGTNYCIAVSAAALLFQITFPWLSERKKWCLKTNPATWCKVAMEVMGVMLLILYSIISWIGILIYCFWFNKGHITENLFPSVSIVIVFINPRRACAARVTVLVLSVCQSVSVSVHDYSRTAGNEAASERYQQLQRNKRSKIKKAILLKRRRSRSRNWHYRGPRCVTLPIN